MVHDDTVIKTILKWTENFLLNEVKIGIAQRDYRTTLLERLTFSLPTSFITVSKPINSIALFSFDKLLLDILFEYYTKNLKYSETERDVLIENVASDVVNIIIGHATEDFQKDGAIITISPPYFFKESRHLTCPKGVRFFGTTMTTPVGHLDIHCIEPMELFDNNLNYKE